MTNCLTVCSTSSRSPSSVPVCGWRAVPGMSWDRLLFSAKESVYKAWFPLAKRWLGFEDADISVSMEGTFDARLLVPGPDIGGTPLTRFTGQWLAGNGLIVTAIAVPAQFKPPPDR